MKISYERLNQIIEEEVTRFKSLNEQSVDPIDSARTRIRNAIDQVKDVAVLNSVATTLETAAKKAKTVSVGV
jgi:hypothetical protein